MSRRATTLLAVFLTMLGATIGVPAAPGAQAPAPGQERTPPRLSFVDGQVSFWRPGAPEWTEARVNTPMAPGDELFAGSPGTVEVQIGGQAYARAWGQTQLGVEGVTTDYVQLKVTTGHAGLDLRRLDPGQTIELDTPSGAFRIEGPGYYRVDVAGDRTTFITRHGGRATLTPVGGTTSTIGENEQVVVDGTTSPSVAADAAPELDAWDQWNTARTDALLATVSAHYVSPDVYGVSDLDHYGAWRVAGSYGSVWVPNGLPADWVPYSHGRWIWDPLYGWTWVESAPWGWAPFHYGRWVYVGDSWAWAPGPRVARPVYAPALVAFFGGGPGVAVGVAGPSIGWVALGWGEPLIPWWGRAGFVGVPCWAGWGGPRVVNNVVVSHTTVVNVARVTVFRNAAVKNAVVAVPRDRFGRTPVARARARQVDVRALAPVRGAIGVTPVGTSLVPDTTRGAQPPAAARRAVVATRDPEDPTRRLAAHGLAAPRAVEEPRPRLVQPSPRSEARPMTRRPSVDATPVERSRPAQPPAAVRPSSRVAPAAPSAPETTTGPTPAPAASAPTPARARAERPSAPSRPVAPAISPAPPRRPEPALRDPAASRPLSGRIEPGGARVVAPRATPATRVSPPLMGRRPEAPASTGRAGAGPAPRHGGSPR